VSSVTLTIGQQTCIGSVLCEYRERIPHKATAFDLDQATVTRNAHQIAAFCKGAYMPTTVREIRRKALTRTVICDDYLG
jgi:hypothetical protein